MTREWIFGIALAMATSALAQSGLTPLPAGTVLSARIDHHVPMRIGQPLHATLLYPVYQGTRLILPAHTALDGKVIGFHSDRGRRIRSAFNLDFTAFHIPIVQFSSLSLDGGELLPIATNPTSDGVTILRLSASQTRSHGNLVHRELAAAVRTTRDTLSFFVAPGRGDRLLQLTYHQLPWHPQRIESGTAWSVETVAPLSIPQTVATLARSDDAANSRSIEAILDRAISSDTARPGDMVQATVAAPVHDPDGNVTIPQGAVLSGTVTEAVASRDFGRSGKLRFAFNRITFPSGTQQAIVSDLAAVDSSASNRITLDSEGEVRPQSRDKIIVPAILVALAAAPLNPDPTDNDEFIKNGGASNSLGVPGFITGLAYNGAALSATFGFYGAALSINDRWIRHGDKVVFPRFTRVVVHIDSRETTTASVTPH